ncbi:PREDICTED: acanthoscurrin-2-like [Ipomoea nil]|uniref:acanthoscurrin-2-like n=1 Tax=Ipomoea nil TaxID=35883 RepID=UPI0009018DF9|nr:PREDICTED: acanthoscurrin-2-like [Ipomoea nil]
MADDVVMDGVVNRRDVGQAEMEETRERRLSEEVNMHRMMDGRQEPRRTINWGQVGRELGVDGGSQPTGMLRESGGRGERGGGLGNEGVALAGDHGGGFGEDVGGLDGGVGGSRGDVSSMGRGGMVAVRISVGGGLGGLHGSKG